MNKKLLGGLGLFGMIVLTVVLDSCIAQEENLMQNECCGFIEEGIKVRCPNRRICSNLQYCRADIYILGMFSWSKIIHTDEYLRVFPLLFSAKLYGICDGVITTTTTTPIITTTTPVTTTTVYYPTTTPFMTTTTTPSTGCCGLMMEGSRVSCPYGCEGTSDYSCRADVYRFGMFIYSRFLDPRESLRVLPLLYSIKLYGNCDGMATTTTTTTPMTTTLVATTTFPTITTIGCQQGWLNEYRCQGNWVQRKYQHQGCTVTWENWGYCEHGCYNAECIQSITTTPLTTTVPTTTIGTTTTPVMTTTPGCLPSGYEGNSIVGFTGIRNKYGWKPILGFYKLLRYAEKTDKLDDIYSVEYDHDSLEIIIAMMAIGGNDETIIDHYKSAGFPDAEYAYQQLLPILRDAPPEPYDYVIPSDLPPNPNCIATHSGKYIQFCDVPADFTWEGGLTYGRDITIERSRIIELLDNAVKHELYFYQSPYPLPYKIAFKYKSDTNQAYASNPIIIGDLYWNGLEPRLAVYLHEVGHTFDATSSRIASSTRGGYNTIQALASMGGFYGLEKAYSNICDGDEIIDWPLKQLHWTRMMVYQRIFETRIRMKEIDPCPSDWSVASRNPCESINCNNEIFYAAITMGDVTSEKNWPIRAIGPFCNNLHATGIFNTCEWSRGESIMTVEMCRW